MRSPTKFLIAALAILTTLPTTAQLPTLTRNPWKECFLAIKESKFQFCILPNLDGELDPLDRRDEKISANNPIKIEFEILETSSDGKSVSKKIWQSSLKSSSGAVKDPKEPVTITGTVTGDAAFEITITPAKKGFSLTGKITDTGTLKKPLTFVITAKLTPYHYQTASDEDDLKKFEKKIRREKLSITLPPDNTKEIPFTEKLDLAEKFPKGIKSIQIETEAYGGTTFTFSSSGKSKIMFEERYADYIWNQFNLRWTSDPSEDLSTQAFIISGE